MKNCPECDQELADDAVHCGHCGARVEEKKDDERNKTMFGMGGISQDDLREAAEDAKEKSASQGGGSSAEDSADSAEEKQKDEGGDDGGFRLPTPGEMGNAPDEEGSEADASDAAAVDDKPGGEGGTRLGMSELPDDQKAGFAKTEALPEVGEEESGEEISTQGDSGLGGGRLSSPGGDEASGGMGAGPDRSDQPSPSNDSPFAVGDKPAPAGESGQSSEDIGLADTPPPQSAPDLADETGAAGPTDPDPSPAGGAASAGGPTDPSPSGGTSSGVGPIDSSPGSSPSPAAGPTDPDPSPAGAGAQGPSRSTTPDSTGGGADVATKEPGGGQADEAAGGGLTNDARFGGDDDEPMANSATGSEVGQRELEMDPPTSSDTGSGNKKVILIVVGILGASFMLCVGVGILAWALGYV